MQVTDRFDLGYLAELIAKERKEVDGRLGFDSYEIAKVQSVLDSYVRFDESIPDVDRHALIWKAISTSAESKKVDGKVLRARLHQVEQEYLNKPLRQFRFATSFTFPAFEELSKLTIGGVTFRFGAVFPKTIRADSFHGALKRFATVKHADSFCKCWGNVVGRTEHAAFDAATSRLELVRALWNFGYNSQTLMRHSIPRRPVNEIVMGPVYTLQALGHAAIAPRVWHSLPNEQSSDLFDFKPHWNAMYPVQRLFQRIVAIHPYGPTLRDLLVRYGRALDGIDYDVSFMRLWSVLEGLTGKPEKSDRLISRTSALYPDEARAETTMILRHLREVRNGNAHEGRERSNIERYLFQLKNYVEAALQFHLLIDPPFQTMGVATRFMDIAEDGSRLAENLRLHQLASKFRKMTTGVS